MKSPVEKLRKEIAAREREHAKQMEGPLHPRVSLLSKLGSIVVHADELTSPAGHHYDMAVLKTLLADPEVKEWLAGMGAFIPVKR